MRCRGRMGAQGASRIQYTTICCKCDTELLDYDVLLPGEDDETVSRESQCSRRWHLIPAENVVCGRATGISDGVWCWRAIIAVAVENFSPKAAEEKPDSIAEVVHLL